LDACAKCGKKFFLQIQCDSETVYDVSRGFGYTHSLNERNPYNPFRGMKLCEKCYREVYENSPALSKGDSANDKSDCSDEKELLVCKHAILTDKKLYIIQEINGWLETIKVKEPINFKDIVEVYTSNSTVPKVVLRLSNNSTKEFSAGDTRSGLDKATSFFIGTDFFLLNTQKGMQVSCERWVNLINNAMQKDKEKERIQIIIDFSSLKDVMSKGGIVMTSYKCPECNGKLDIPETGKVLICSYCGTPIKPVDIFEKIKSLIQ
jgi:DNA-directed RNA polymerase subunit RPC12/RpoP